jgi:hypothetical protein
MRSADKLIDELDWLTNKICSQVWTLNLGALATTWSLLIAAGKVRIEAADAIPIMGLCIFAMLCELAQYLAGYVNARRILKSLRDSGRTEFEFDKSAPLYILREACFYAKIVLSVAAAIWLLVVLVWKVV